MCHDLVSPNFEKEKKMHLEIVPPIGLVWVMTSYGYIYLRFDLNIFGGGLGLFYHVGYILKDYIPVLQFLKDFAEAFVEAFWELGIKHAPLVSQFCNVFCNLSSRFLSMHEIICV